MNVPGTSEFLSTLLDSSMQFHTHAFSKSSPMQVHRIFLFRESFAPVFFGGHKSMPSTADFLTNYYRI